MSKQPWTSLRGLFFQNSVKSGWQAKKDIMLQLRVSLEKPREIAHASLSSNTWEQAEMGDLGGSPGTRGGSSNHPFTHSQHHGPSSCLLTLPDRENTQMHTLQSKGIIRLKKSSAAKTHTLLQVHSLEIPALPCKYNSNSSFSANSLPSVGFQSAVHTMGQIWPGDSDWSVDAGSLFINLS